MAGRGELRHIESQLEELRCRVKKLEDLLELVDIDVKEWDFDSDDLLLASASGDRLAFATADLEVGVVNAALPACDPVYLSNLKGLCVKQIIFTNRNMVVYCRESGECYHCWGVFSAESDFGFELERFMYIGHELEFDRYYWAETENSDVALELTQVESWKYSVGEDNHIAVLKDHGSQYAWIFVADIDSCKTLWKSALPESLNVFCGFSTLYVVRKGQVEARSYEGGQFIYQFSDKGFQPSVIKESANWVFGLQRKKSVWVWDHSGTRILTIEGAVDFSRLPPLNSYVYTQRSRKGYDLLCVFKGQQLWSTTFPSALRLIYVCCSFITVQTSGTLKIFNTKTGSLIASVPGGPKVLAASRHFVVTDFKSYRFQ